MSEAAIVNRDYAPHRDYSHPQEYPRQRSGTRAGFPAGDEKPARSARSARSGDEASRAFRMAIAVSLAIAAVAALFFVAVMPLTEIRTVRITGATTLGQAELSAWSGLSGRTYWFSVDTAAVESSLLAHPRVAGVSVERHFPNVLVAAVVERVPVAVVYARGQSGRTEAHCVDGLGVVFAPATAYPAAGNLPVLSGLEIRGLHYGLRLDGPFADVLASLSEVLGSNPALVSAISELRVVSRDGAPAELLVYPARYRVPVRMRPVLNAGLLKSMMLVLDVVEGEGLSPTIRELDLRTDTFVYRTKEAVSG